MVIKNIFFDMGHTLVYRPYDTETAIHMLLEDLGYDVPAQSFAEAYNQARIAVPAQPASAPGQPPDREGYKRTLQQAREHSYNRTKKAIEFLGMSPSDEITRQILKADFNSYQLYPDAVPTLRRARACGYRLGIISNWDPGLMGFCRQIGIRDYFDTIIASRALGYKKWWPEIFMAALASIGGVAEESVHIGDSPGSDAWGALSVGIHPVVIDREGQYRRLFCSVIRSLDGILPLAESI